MESRDHEGEMLTGLPYYHSYTTQDYLPGDGITHSELGPPLTPVIMQNAHHPHELSLEGSLKDEIPQLNSLFPDDSSLCQVDKKKKLTGTQILKQQHLECINPIIHQPKGYNSIGGL